MIVTTPIYGKTFYLSQRSTCGNPPPELWDVILLKIFVQNFTKIKP